MRPAAEIDAHIRGLSPFPGAWCEAPDGTRMKVLMSRLSLNGTGEPGEVLDDTLLVGCGEGAVRLMRVQREGRAAQDAGEFLKGFPITAGAMLG